jgi:ABC-type multidrug transport system fused ATPase/permease subunit
VLAQIWGILTGEQKRGVFLLMVGGLFLALLDTITVALMAPFMTLMTNLSGYEESIFGRFMARTFGVTSTNQAILILTVGFIVLYIIRGICKILYQFWQARKVANYRADLATRLFSNIMYKPYAFHLTHNSAETQRLVNNDVFRVYMILSSLISSASYLLTVIGIVIVLLSMNVVLTGILFALIFVFMLWVRLGLKKKIDRYSGLSHKANTDTFAWVAQSLGGLKSILVKRKQGFYVQRYTGLADISADCEASYQAIDMMPKVLVDTGCMLMVFGTVLVELLLGRDIGNTLPMFAAFAIAAMRMIPIVSNLTSVINSMNYFRPSVAVVYDIVRNGGSEGTRPAGDAVPAIPAGSHPVLTDGIELSHVAFRYDEAKESLYEDLNLTIPARKSVAFVGTTGSGKTTLADIILGLHKPTGGKVTADGIDIAEQPEWWSSMLGYIPQFVYLCDDTIRANVAFGEEKKDVSDEWVWQCLERAQMREFVESLPDGLDTVTGENGVRLSGGQRQRIGIARALYSRPQFLVMDEATSSLDGETEQAIVQAINSLSGDITILIIAHRLSTIENCDIVYRIENGKATRERG